MGKVLVGNHPAEDELRATGLGSSISEGYAGSDLLRVRGVGRGFKFGGH